MAITILKRGGETIHWGAKWKSPAWKLYTRFLELDRKEELSGKFASALAQLLSPYQLNRKIDSIDTDTMQKITLNEFCHVVEQQGRKELVDGLRKLAEPYMKELAGGFGKTPESESGPKPKLDDFAKLFLTAAFIFRDRSEY